MSDKKRPSRLIRTKEFWKSFLHVSRSRELTPDDSISNQAIEAKSPEVTDTKAQIATPESTVPQIVLGHPSADQDSSSTPQNPPADPHLVQPGPESDAVPPIVRADIILVYNGQTYTSLKDQEIHWTDRDYHRSQYRDFDSEAIRYLRQHPEVDESKQFYRKTGLCRLIRDDYRHEDTVILENEQHWSEKIPLLIAKFCSSNPYAYDRFHLEIRLHYSDLSINKVEGEQYSSTVRKVIQSKLQKNWDDDPYIPRKDIDEIFSEGTIKELINSDESLAKLSQKPTIREQPFDKNKFITSVIGWASRGLALCVYSRLPLACLYHLMVKGYEDAKLPLTDMHCPDDEYQAEFADLIMFQWRFIAHTFMEGVRPKHEKLRDKVVVPFKNLGFIAEGGFGRVFKVQIDPDHHLFGSDRDAPFALKRFFQIGSRTEEDFNREERMLQTLSEFPHPHITPHLASWTQKETFFMLFPLADMNFGTFLRQMPHPELENEFVHWLFVQLKGLADGVRHIHNLGPSGLGPESLLKTLPSSKRPGRTGFHHDLKPENLLVFARTDPNNPNFKITDCVLKISDFGAARINVILSQSGANPITSYKMSSLTHGDSVYGAPDYALEGQTSRPYDLWSLGCVFLEVLIWTFGLSNSDLVTFRKERLHSRRAPMNQDTAFWHRDKDGKVRLKAAVVKHLRQLQNHCQGRGVFEHLVRSTGRLLIKLPSDRSKAQDICTELDAALLQLQVDLRKSGFYLHDIDDYRPVAAPPTMVSNENSRRPSIDERSIYAPEDGFLRVGDHGQRRSSQPSGRGGSEARRLEHSTSEPIPARKISPPLITQDLSAGPSHSKSPSISISNADDPFSAASTVDDNIEPFPQAPIGSHEDDYQPGREDFMSRPRARSSDSRSFSLP